MPFSIVMPGLVPGIHGLQPRESKTWMAGTSPAMTTFDGLDSTQGSVLVATKPEPDNRGLDPAVHVIAAARTQAVDA
ncbi:MAG TPA: hypothetical protein VMC10_22710 [Stellaceae bacterium]|nr:hypothetical protein [Stellaceae bacterium]